MTHPNLTPSLNEWAARIHQIAVDHGFWEADRNFGEMVALAHSELSEALEEHRAGAPAIHFPVHKPGCAISDYHLFQKPIDVDAHHEGRFHGFCIHAENRGECDKGYPDPPCTCTPKPEGVAVELADCIIRCLDTLHSLGVNIDEVVATKVAYNASRPHKHGKAY